MWEITYIISGSLFLLASWRFSEACSEQAKPRPHAQDWLEEYRRGKSRRQTLLGRGSDWIRHPSLRLNVGLHTKTQH